MMSESLMVIMLIMLSAQSSSLWSSLATIPISVAAIYTSSNMNILSGVLMMVFIMVFIGGLLVLLVSVASISYQEQGYNFSKIWGTISLTLTLPFLLEYLVPSNSSNIISLSSWFEDQPYLSMILVALMLLALLTISLNILAFKGLIRSM